jgi:hypothetical protein
MKIEKLMRKLDRIWMEEGNIRVVLPQISEENEKKSILVGRY